MSILSMKFDLYSIENSLKPVPAMPLKVFGLALVKGRP